MDIIIHKNDIPDSFLNSDSVSIDTETMGLKPHRDRLCLVQMSDSPESCHIVQFDRFDAAKNLKSLLSNPRIQKIFHYARFDVMMMYKYLGVMTKNIYCTKIASKLARTYTGKHSLSALCDELLGIVLSKEQTCTDWGRNTLTDAQKEYSAKDVLYLKQLKDKLTEMLERENRLELAYKCFDFIETRVTLDLMVDENYDIFSHGA